MLNRAILSLILMASALTASAQQSYRRSQDSWRSDYTSANSRRDADASVLDLHLRRPGDLERQILPQDRAQVTTLILQGVINDADLHVIAELAKRSKITVRGSEVKAYLNVDLENVRYFNGDRECDYLPDYAFMNCRTLRSIVLPYRLRELGRNAFYGCSSLVAVAMPDDLDRIGQSAFYDCTSLTSIYIPDYVTDIQYETFRGCTALKKVSLPDGLITIGENAFRGTGLTDIALPATLRTIGPCAFANTQIRTARIAATLEHCAANAFSTPVLNAYEVEEGNREYSSHQGVLYSADGHRLIAYPDGRSGSFVVPEFVTDIAPGVFRSNNRITSIEFECPLTVIQDGMFQECQSLFRVIVPEGVESIGREAFRGCKALTTVTLPSTLRSIGAMAFRACKGMSHIDLPDGLEYIDEEAFDYCTHLTDLTVPATVRQIGNKAFYNCDRMLQLIVLAPKPPVAAEKLNDNLKKITLRVPAGSIDAYRAANGWSKFKLITESEDTMM